MNRNLADTLNALNHSTFRSKFSLSGKDIIYVKQKGLDTIHTHATDFIAARIAPAQPKNDGKQTPMKNHPVFIAQHATATCCRGCIEKWHGIGRGSRLSAAEVGFVVSLVMEWITLQVEKAAVND